MGAELKKNNNNENEGILYMMTFTITVYVAFFINLHTLYILFYKDCKGLNKTSNFVKFLADPI